MTRNAITVGASAATVFSVLSDPRAYDQLLPGARRMRRFDQHWPGAGSALHQTLGFGSLGLPEAVEVVEVDEPSVLRLRARMMPLCVHRIDFVLRTEDGGTYVRIDAWPVSGLTSRVWNPLLEQLAWSRNEELLRRLRGLVEYRRHPLGV